MKIRRYLTILLMFLLLSFSLTAFASPLTAGNIISFSDVEIQADQHVKSILVVGGNANIAGHVEDEVVVINGNVVLSSSSNIRDHVMVLGGSISAEEGAYIGKGFFQFGSGFLGLNSLLMAGLFIVLFWLIQFAVTAILLFVPVVFFWLKPILISQLSQIVSVNKFKALFMGILAILASLIIISIFSISIIGIPVAIVLLFLLLIIASIGISSISLWLGSVISKNTTFKETNKSLSVFIGSLFIALLFNIPLIGIFLLVLSISVGFGAILIKLFSKTSVHES